MASAADSPVTMEVLRFLAGLGLGGAMPNAAALAAELVPRHDRALAVTVAIVCVPLGGMAAFLAWGHTCRLSPLTSVFHFQSR